MFSFNSSIDDVSRHSKYSKYNMEWINTMFSFNPSIDDVSGHSEYSKYSR